MKACETADYDEACPCGKVPERLGPIRALQAEGNSCEVTVNLPSSMCRYTEERGGTKTVKTTIAICVCVLLFGAISIASASGPYTSTIEKLQVTDVGSPFNTVFLTLDITDSPCSSTNSNNRFTVVNHAQLSTILAAVMANKSITITGTGTCNGGNVEEISALTVSP